MTVNCHMFYFALRKIFHLTGVLAMIDMRNISRTTESTLYYIHICMIYRILSKLLDTYPSLVVFTATAGQSVRQGNPYVINPIRSWLMVLLSVATVLVS